MKESGVIITRLGDEDEKTIIFCPGCGAENIVEEIIISPTYETIDLSCFGIFKYIYRWKRLKCDICQSIFIKYDVDREIQKKVINTIIFSIMSFVILICAIIYVCSNKEILFDTMSTVEDFYGAMLVSISVVLIIISFIFMKENCSKKIFRIKPEDLLR